MKRLARRWWVVVMVLGVLAVLPLTAAAITNTEVIAILNAGIAGLRTLVQDAYCAAGVNAFCP